MLEVALLILTLAAEGEPRLTLSPTEHMEDCLAMQDVVTQILTEAGQPPLLTRCGETDVRLSPFIHGTPPEAEIHRYRVELPAEDGYRVFPLTDDQSCTADEVAELAIYCTRSAQFVQNDG